MAIEDRYTTERANKISNTHSFYNLCWKLYNAMRLQKDPLAEQYVDLDYKTFIKTISLAYKGQFKYPLFDKILRKAKKLKFEN